MSLYITPRLNRLLELHMRRYERKRSKDFNAGSANSMSKCDLFDCCIFRGSPEIVRGIFRIHFASAAVRGSRSHCAKVTFTNSLLSILKSFFIFFSFPFFHPHVTLKTTRGRVAFVVRVVPLSPRPGTVTSLHAPTCRVLSSASQSSPSSICSNFTARLIRNCKSRACCSNHFTLRRRPGRSHWNNENLFSNTRMIPLRVAITSLPVQRLSAIFFSVIIRPNKAQAARLAHCRPSFIRAGLERDEKVESDQKSMLTLCVCVFVDRWCQSLSQYIASLFHQSRRDHQLTDFWPISRTQNTHSSCVCRFF